MNSEKEIGETAVTGWKRCTLCSYVKPTTEFHKTQNNKDGLAARCKPCFSEVQRARYARNPEAMRQRKREYHRNNPAAAKRSGLHRNGTRDPGKPWPPGRIGYEAAHHRVKAIHGPASGHMCVQDGCDSPARDWAFAGYGDPANHYAGLAWCGNGNYQHMTWSVDPSDYIPVCRSHHMRKIDT